MQFFFGWLRVELRAEGAPTAPVKVASAWIESTLCFAMWTAFLWSSMRRPAWCASLPSGAWPAARSFRSDGVMRPRRVSREAA